MRYRYGWACVWFVFHGSGLRVSPGSGFMAAAMVLGATTIIVVALSGDKFALFRHLGVLIIDICRFDQGEWFTSIWVHSFC
jgi:hypothetical protein